MRELEETPEILKAYKSQHNQKKVKRLSKVISGYEKIVYATDQDLDGFHIRGLLSCFVRKYLLDYSDKIGMLETPVIATFKNGKIQKWAYNLGESLPEKPGETKMYFKGLGSWNKDDLKTVISKDGLDKLIHPIDFCDANEDIDNWFGKDSDIRKDFIVRNDFNIADI